MNACKRALAEADGDEEKAIETLRKAGEKLELKRAGRETDFGRFGIFCGLDKNVGAMVELNHPVRLVRGDQPEKMRRASRRTRATPRVMERLPRCAAAARRSAARNASRSNIRTLALGCPGLLTALPG